MTFRLLIAAASFLTSACATRPPIPPPPAPVVDAGDDLVVTLTWAAPVDLDLYVTDPSWETVYFGNNPSRAGGRLERDDRCSAPESTGPHVEIVRLPSPRDGSYRVGVDFIDACGSGIKQSGFRVAIALPSERREVTATATVNVFAPIVLELQVARSDDGTPVFVSK